MKNLAECIATVLVIYKIPTAVSTTTNVKIQDVLIISANTVIVRGEDLDDQIEMRRLAGYAGAAHIRTPDGSSVACDIQVRESQSYDSQRVSYSLAIKVVDPQAPEGMTLAEWNSMNPVE